MRDPRYVAEHRGGPLTRGQHQALARWAAVCAERTLGLFEAERPDDPRPRAALEAARAWARGESGAGPRAASVAAHAAAREATSEAARHAARACGHAVATGHMADHAPGGALYAVKALLATEGRAAAEAEHRWQRAQLPAEVAALVLSTFREARGYPELMRG